MNFEVDQNGFYGTYGGAFIPEILYPNIRELQENYLEIMDSASFREAFHNLLNHFAGRPSPLYYAERLSEKYRTRIYLKREDLNHTGSHKLNNVIGQILIAQRLGKKRIIAETGAGQHGVATATVCARMGLPCIVYMGQKDVRRQAPNVERMRMLGAEVRPVTSGSMTLKDATNEAIRDWIQHVDDTHYVIGSVVGPHPYPDMVARLQSVISKELLGQLQEAEGRDYPDHILACVGGGSNAAGIYYHYLDRPEVELIAAEAAGLGVDTGKTAATSYAGTKGVLHAAMTLLMQDQDGQVVEPYSISAGLDYPGIGPLHAHLLDTGRLTSFAVTDGQAVEAAYELSRMEGIIPALETAHALAVLGMRTFDPGKVVVINLSGRGDKDLDTFAGYTAKYGKQ